MYRTTDRSAKKKTADKLQTADTEEKPKSKKKQISKDEGENKPSTSKTPRPSSIKTDTRVPPKPVSRITLATNSRSDNEFIKKSVSSSSKLAVNKHISSKDVSRPKTKIDNILPPKLVSHSKRDDIPKHNLVKKTDQNELKQKTPKTAKDLPFVSVTVNSPISTRKLPNNKASNIQNNVIKSSRPSSSGTKSEIDYILHRDRSRTVTLKEDEIKICSSLCTPDNNEEMRKLNSKLGALANPTLRANPQAFFVDLDGNSSKNNTQTKESDEDSYEDDFENYESDFDSYNSSESAEATNSSYSSSKKYNIDDDLNASTSKEYDSHTDSITAIDGTASVSVKRSLSTDEERMLDSGSYDLREAQRSAAKVKTAKMDEIREAPVEIGGDAGDDHSKSKAASITDEGFIEMSVSGTNSVPTKFDAITQNKRPDFIDLKRSRERNRLRMKQEKMAQRARDLLAMITLDQISYTLLDIPPISYDIFMQMHSKGNSNQRSIQTNDDWVSEEIQTDEIFKENKWTQFPIKFSNDEIYLTENKSEIILSNDLLEKARLFLDYNHNLDENVTSGNGNTLKNNPIRIFLEQRKGCGSDSVLSRKKYDECFDRAKHFDEKKLNNFIDRAGSFILKILDNSSNWNNDKNVNVKCMKSDWPFSESFQVLLSNDSEGLFYLKDRAIEKVLFSENSTHHILTVHSIPVLPGVNNNFDGFEDDLKRKCLMCIWESDGNVPRKVLTVCDGVAACIYRGNINGMVFAALDDGCICVWDLNERQFWHQTLLKQPQSNQKQDKTLTKELTTTLADRNWSEQRLEKSPEKDVAYIFRTCAFSSSASCRKAREKWFGKVVSLVFKEYGGLKNGTSGVGDNEMHGILGQLYLLQEYGNITIWSVFRTKEFNKPGSISVGDTSAYWSKIYLNRSYEINLQTYIDVPIQDIREISNGFNLTTAKRRNNLKRQINLKINKKTKEAILDSSSSIASGKNDGKSGRISPCNWECAVLCTDFKVLTEKGNADQYFVARNCGEVICCRRKDEDFHIQRYKVTDATNTITSIEFSPSNKSYFLAGTDTGNICLFSIEASRTLLTLNCNSTNEKTKVELNRVAEKIKKIELKKVWWFQNDECCFLTLSSDGILRLWDLVRSDIYPLYTVGGTDGLLTEANLAMDFGNSCLRLAVLTSGGRVEIHKLLSVGTKNERHDLFTKYVALL